MPIGRLAGRCDLTLLDKLKKNWHLSEVKSPFTLNLLLTSTSALNYFAIYSSFFVCILSIAESEWCRETFSWELDTFCYSSDLITSKLTAYLCIIRTPWNISILKSLPYYKIISIWLAIACLIFWRVSKFGSHRNSWDQRKFSGFKEKTETKKSFDEKEKRVITWHHFVLCCFYNFRRACLLCFKHIFLNIKFLNSSLSYMTCYLQWKVPYQSMIKWWYLFWFIQSRHTVPAFHLLYKFIHSESHLFLKLCIIPLYIPLLYVKMTIWSKSPSKQ